MALIMVWEESVKGGEDWWPPPPPLLFMQDRFRGQSVLSPIPSFHLSFLPFFFPSFFPFSDLALDLMAGISSPPPPQE